MESRKERSVVGAAGAERPQFAFQESLKTWAGHGTGIICNLCGRSIAANEIEYEIELPPGSAGSSLHFHFNCYRTWVARGGGSGAP